MTKMYFFYLAASLILFATTNGQIPIYDNLGVVCSECARIINGSYVGTAKNGTVVAQFLCDPDNANIVEQQFCRNPSRRTIDAVVPRPDEVCVNNQMPITCLDEDVEPITVWSDGRLDPNYETARVLTADILAKARTGKYRDVDPDFYNRLAFRSKHTPKDPPNVSQGEPDIYASYDTSIYRMLSGYATGYRDLSPADAASFAAQTQLPLLLPHLPRYHHFNKRMLMYFGAWDINTSRLNIAPCPKYDPAANLVDGFKCWAGTLIDYVTRHRKITTRPISYQSNLDVIVNDASTPKATTPFCINTRSPCDGYFECTTNMTDADARIGTITVGFFSGFGMVRVVHQPCGWGTSATSITKYTMYPFKIDDKLAPYPMFLMPQMGLSHIDGHSKITYVEESMDGTTWTLHPETVHVFIADLIRNARYVDIPQYLGESRLWHSAATGDYRRVYINTGENKYMRIISLLFRGAHRSPGASNPTVNGLFYPAYYLTAEERAPTEVVVVSSLPRQSSQIGAMDRYGFTFCKDIPGCTYLEMPTSLYPDALSDTPSFAGGSPTVRKFFNDVVAPVLFPEKCKKVIEDPAKVLLRDKAMGNSTCYRLSRNPSELTCYTYSSNLVSSTADPVIETDGNTYAKYIVSRVTLVVTKSNSVNNNGPTPIAILGKPFTPQNRKALAYLYNKEVKNSRRIDNTNIWVSASEACSFGTALGSLSQSSTCTCHPYQIGRDVCLCMSGTQYKQLPSVGSTGTTAQNLTALKIPSMFTDQSMYISHNTDVYTDIDFSCKNFLCGSTGMCTQQTTSIKDVHLFECENLLRSIRAALKKVGVANDAAIAALVKAAETHPGVPSSSFQTEASKIVPVGVRSRVGTAYQFRSSVYGNPVSQLGRGFATDAEVSYQTSMNLNDAIHVLEDGKVHFDKEEVAMADGDYNVIAQVRLKSLKLYRSNILASAVEHELRGLNFARRVSECVTKETRDTYACTGSDSILTALSTVLSGKNLHAELRVRVPSAYQTVESIDGFCSNGYTYRLTNPGRTTFLISDVGDVSVSELNNYNPQGLSAANTLQGAGCSTDLPVLDVAVSFGDFSITEILLITAVSVLGAFATFITVHIIISKYTATPDGKGKYSVLL